MTIFFLIFFLYLLPAGICYFCIRWQFTNYYVGEKPAMIDVLSTLFPIINIVEALYNIYETLTMVIKLKSKKGIFDSFPERFFRIKK